jgi:hypothetical protein
MSLDNVALLDSSNQPIRQTQDAHITQFNSLNKIMASLADYYQAAKSGDTNLISGIRADANNWIVGSDRIVYEKDSLEATITSYFGSTVIEPFQRKVHIPQYNGIILDSVLADPLGLIYLQSLFNTSDNVEEMKKTLTDLSGKSSGETKVWTPDQSSRNSNPNRATFLDCSYGNFHIVGSYDLDLDGRSRGVLESPAGTALDNKYMIPVSTVQISPNLKQGINKKSECVYLSNIQEIDDLSKYAGIFFFHNNRFVYSMTSQKMEDDIIDKAISSILALPKTTVEKLGTLEETFNPIYAHLQRYEKNEKGFSLVDDAEAFAEPKLLVKK